MAKKIKMLNLKLREEQQSKFVMEWM